MKELVVRGLTVSYGAVQALTGVNLNVDAGEVVVAAGPNGSGKTTLLRAVAGLAPVEGGRVSYDGTDITAWPAWRRSRLGVVYAAERARVAAGMSVYENLVVGAWAKKDTAALAGIFDLFPCLAVKRHQKAGLLSGGERQMLVIGRALMTQPACLLLDEPFFGLNRATKEILAALLQKVRRRGAGVLISEHDLAFAGRVADRIYGFRDGKVVFTGSLAEFQDRDVMERIYA